MADISLVEQSAINQPFILIKVGNAGFLEKDA
jgi:hypothetical protein